MTRREARAEIISLLFESGFHTDETPVEIYERALTARDIGEDEYVKSVFFGTVEHMEFLDELITANSNKWKKERISPVSRAVMRLAIYEMYFRDDVPDAVAVNEAIELVKIYDDADKVRSFVNGVLNAVLQAKRTKNAELS